MDIIRPSSLAALSRLAVSAHCSANRSSSTLANVGMGHLPAAEADGDLDAVAVGEELLRVACSLVLKSPMSMPGRHPDLLDLHHVLVLSGLFFPLALLEPELAVVHQLAHGRRSAWGEILTRSRPCSSAIFRASAGGHDAQLLALGTDQADLLVADLLVQFMHYFTNGRSTSISKSQNADTHAGIRATTNHPHGGLITNSCRTSLPSIAGGEADAVSLLCFAGLV